MISDKPAPVAAEARPALAHCETAAVPKPQSPLFVMHETWGRTYFSHLEHQFSVNYVEISFLKNAVRSLMKPGAFPFNWKRGLLNSVARFVAMLSAKDKLIAIAPFDFRICYCILWLLSGKRGNIIYHTSWPTWTTTIPHDYGLLTPIFRRIFTIFLAQTKVRAVAVTPEAAKSLQQFQPLASPVVVPHPVEFAFYRSVSIRAPAVPLNVGFAGRLLKEKGVREFIEIARQLTTTGRFRFHICGDGPERTAVEAAKGEGHLSYWGPLPYPQGIASYFHRLDVLCVPSQRTKTWEELFGRVVIEAQAAGLVVLSSDHVGPRRLIEDGVNGFLMREKESSEWIARLEMLASAPDEMLSVARAGSESAKKFRADLVSAAFGDLFDTQKASKAANATTPCCIRSS